ncbi:MAG: glutamine--fructose-6-phosphate transaminase (isomerizing) [Alphaproteobacteria bacterium CG11_big_fil_rev_8_21_14_0_20_44_7]|nr:MAG: glutamine--fructose-6-phosphate transaminase (isomerizing) [Alphaproteobacteria bacterium CG11_big_fil_rev_8_21_14_0_20_44_7]
MCGIVGIVSSENVSQKIFESLERLEYRGYDSAGIAVVNGELQRRRAQGKLANLKKELKKSPIAGNAGIGHTRWATHGLPITENAHPHSTAKVSVVHNGIIENFLELRKELEKAGYKFTSQTDTEVIPILITYYLDNGESDFKAFQKTISRLHGAFAIGAIFNGNDNLLMAAKRGSPLAIGYGDDEMFMASDAIALAPLSQKICYLEDDDIAKITSTSCEVFGKDGKSAEREVKISNISGAAVGKGNYRHFMLKEIHEQPIAIAQTLNAYYDPFNAKINLPKAKFDLRDIRKITIVACGTSYYAGMVAKYWIEQIAHIPVEVDVASEYRYRKPVYQKGGMFLAISQSGETADTLAAIKHAKAAGQYIASIVNVPQSSIARESDLIIPTLAGPEIGVASTKAFTCQLTALAALAIALTPSVPGLLPQLADVPSLLTDILHIDAYEDLADEMSLAKTVLYIGRGTSYPIAMEGALKLKEISYIHAEGFGAGELKHGPIALIDESVPVVVIAPYDEYFAKTASNVREVAARGGKVILISNSKGCKELKDVTYKCIKMPFVPSFVAPILYAIPAQLLAYHIAVKKGTDVDQPRNLAKSVTVE